MSARFTKKVFNAEDGTRTLGFFVDSVSAALGLEQAAFMTFNLNALEDLRAEKGDLHTARVVAVALQEFLGFDLTPEEIEYSVEDI